MKDIETTVSALVSLDRGEQAKAYFVKEAVVSNPCDATMKYLLEHHPTAWLTFLGLPDTDAEVIEAELPTVTASADKVIRIKTSSSSLLHLAPLSNVKSEELPGVIRRMEERFRAEANPNDTGELWIGTYVLMGLRYPREFAGRLLKGVRDMKESDTYMA